MTTPKGVRETGIPVKSVNWVRLFAATDPEGAPCILSTMGQNGGPMFVLQIDPQTGHCRQFHAPVKGASDPTAAFWSERWGRLFVGSTPGHLFSFAPGDDRLENQGRINPDDATFPCRIDEHPDGRLFIGSHPGCDLTSRDPERESFTRHGRMDPVDMYFYPLCGTDGTVAGLVKTTRPHVVAFDPHSGEHRSVGPVADTDAGQGRVSLHKGPDGLLYIDSHEGIFGVRRMEAVPLAELDGFEDFQTENARWTDVRNALGGKTEATLPDGSTLRFLDAGEYTYRRLEVRPPSGSRRILELDWEGAGTNIYIVRPGPDERLYGSSILPLHLFRHDPQTGRTEDLGACSNSGGELYSMGCMNGRLYMCAYPGARLSVFDPEAPYDFGTEPDSNPRDLGRMDDVAFRPRDMLCGPGGKVWTASIPDYGMWGGTLAWFDPDTEQFGSHRHIIPDCSPISLARLPEKDLIVVGLTINAGSGTEPRAERAGFVLWDPETDEKRWQGDLGLPIISVMDLCDAGEGLTYAILHLADRGEAVLALLDLPGESILKRCALDKTKIGWPLEVSFQPDKDYIYGATRSGIYRIEKGGTEIEMLWQASETDGPTAAGALLAESYYFATGHRLRSLAI